MAHAGLAKLTLAGADAKSFLQGYVTCYLDALAEDAAMPMACCNIKGRVLANGWAAGRDDAVDLFIHASVADRLAAHLAKYLVFAKCSLDRPAARFTIAAAPAGPGAITLRPLPWVLATAEGGAEDALERRCIDAAIGIVRAPVAERFLPQMLGLVELGAVSFTKGCYLGQEVVARAQHRGEVKRRLKRFRWEGVLPAAGAATSPAATVVHATGADGGLALAVTGAADATLRGEGFKLIPATGSGGGAPA